MATPVKWGIMGSAGIAEKVCVAIAEATNATCVAVASRDKAKAEKFIEANCPGARALGSYEELLDDAEIQVVYIPLPTAMRAEWVIKAAAKKKHVLCEKPIAINAKDTKRIIDACRTAGVQFMDNTMFMHNSRQTAMRKVLDDVDLFGKPQHVVSSFTIPLAATSEEFASGNIRMKKATEPLGALGDLGWYCTRFTEWVYNYELPESVSCNFMETTDEGVPIHLMTNLKFSGGRTASFDCSFKHAWRDWAEVVSEKCSLRVEDFVVTAKAGGSSYTVSRGSCAAKGLTFPIEVVKTEDIKENEQHSRLVEKMSSIAASGEIEESWPKLSEQTNLLLLAMVASAKQQGSWITPRGAGKGSGKGKSKTQPEVKVKKARFDKVKKINPDSKGLNFEVKVLSVESLPDSGTPECIAVVGDDTGIVKLHAKGDQVSNISENASLILRNARTRMVRGHIQLAVDKWGKLEVSKEAFDFTPKTEHDVSATEFEMVKA